MKKAGIVVVLLLVVVGLFIYSQRDTVTYTLAEQDQVFKNGEFHLVARISSPPTVETVEVYNEDGTSYGTFTEEDILKSFLENPDMFRKTKLSKGSLAAIGLTSETAEGKTRIYFEFEDANGAYRHVLLPYPTNRSFFYFDPIHVETIDPVFAD